MADKKNQVVEKPKAEAVKSKAAPAPAGLEARTRAAKASLEEAASAARERLEEAGASVRDALEARPPVSELVAASRGEKTAQLQVTAAAARERATLVRSALEEPGEGEEFSLSCRSCGRSVQGQGSWAVLAGELEVVCIDEQGPCTVAAGQETGWNERELERSVVEFEAEPA